jgi:hypothetical protein
VFITRANKALEGCNKNALYALSFFYHELKRTNDVKECSSQDVYILQCNLDTDKDYLKFNYVWEEKKGPCESDFVSIDECLR